MHIYTITTLRIEHNDEHNADYIAASRCVGFFKTLEEAENILNNNVGDIFEFYYNYAVVEKMHPGLYPHDLNFKTYKFDMEKKGFFSCEKPTALENTGSFGIG